MALNGNVFFHPATVDKEHRGELMLRGTGTDGENGARVHTVVLTFGSQEKMKEWLVDVTAKVLGFAQEKRVMGR